MDLLNDSKLVFLSRCNTADHEDLKRGLIVMDTAIETKVTAYGMIDKVIRSKQNTNSTFY